MHTQTVFWDNGVDNFYLLSLLSPSLFVVVIFCSLHITMAFAFGYNVDDNDNKQQQQHMLTHMHGYFIRDRDSSMVSNIFNAYI